MEVKDQVLLGQTGLVGIAEIGRCSYEKVDGRADTEFRGVGRREPEGSLLVSTLSFSKLQIN